MFCTHCGAKLAAGAQFCSQCGAPVKGAGPKTETETLALPADSVYMIDPAARPARQDQELPTVQPSRVEVIVDRGWLHCPNCHSTDIYIDKKGYSLVKGVVGALLIGPLGLIAGKQHSNRLRYTCRHCGYQWHD